MRTVILVTLAATLSWAAKVPDDKLLEMAKNHAPDLEQSLRDTLTDKAIAAGTAYAVDHSDFVAALSDGKGAMLQVDELAPVPSTQIGSLTVYQGPLRAGTSHKYAWVRDGKRYGGVNDIQVFTLDSYPQPGTPEGKLTGPLVMESKVYPGMKANVWYYVPAQWDGSTPLPVQIWGDGQGYVTRPGSHRVFDTLDNMTKQKRIPLMVNVFIQPGTVGTRAMRSIEYDTVDDAYSRYILEDILPEVEKGVKLRQDGYSRAMIGESSGGICSFNAAYFKPDQFSRVMSWIGSFAALQVSDKEPVGGAAYPVKVRRDPKRNIRVWLQDGAEDQENPRAGSWPLANLALANSLKIKLYDYHLSFGVGTHSQSQGASELPESLTWLWRDYDPAKTTQDFTQEPSEKDKPLWRVVTLNR